MEEHAEKDEEHKEDDKQETRKNKVKRRKFNICNIKVRLFIDVFYILDLIL